MKANAGACFIGKPQAGAQGDCIILFRDIKELELKLSCKNNAEYVVQRYIDKPMLVKGYKYDLRIYVAVVGGLGED
jgi:glutathione synthase/RimK-type ligase-like ATP-grasp enzyme